LNQTIGIELGSKIEALKIRSAAGIEPKSEPNEARITALAKNEAGGDLWCVLVQGS
jgi:hypothetical protein